MPKKLRDKLPSLLKRDEHGQIANRDEAKQLTEDLVKKLLTEERAHDKEKSFHRVRTGRRDIVVFMSVCIRNSVDGNVVIGEDESQGYERFDERDLYKYRTFDMATIEFPARMVPMTKSSAGKGLMTGFNVLIKFLSKIGAMR